MKTISRKTLMGIFIICIFSLFFSPPLEAKANQLSLPGSNSNQGGNPNIIGTWTGVVNGQQVDMEIKPGGTMIFAGQTLQYTLQPGQLIITVSGQPTAYGMQVSGNQMMLTGADIGGTVTFTRKGSSPGPGPGGLGSLAGPKTPAPSQPASSPMPNLPGSSFPPASQQPSTSPMNMQFDVYTFKSDPTVKVAYPRGWTVTENQYGVSVVEKQTTDTAGVEIMLLQLPANINSNQALSQMLINNLRQQVYPDLKVLQQGPHPQAPQVLNISLTYSSQGIPFQGLSWCAVNTQNRIGIFATFYAPNNRFSSYNPQQVLVSCMGPMMGGQ
jgi:hypothetical protein